MERKGQWIMTYSGIHFYLLDPRAEDISALDIAHALSNICRYTGHTKYFYSVGTHSILCAEQARNEGASTLIQLYLLLHDATEAYLTDVSRPLKALLGKVYTDMEDAVHKCVFEHFGLPQPTEGEWQIVKHYDNYLLANEIPLLMINPEEFGIEPVYNQIKIPQFSNIYVENRFLEILNYLLAKYKEENANAKLR